MDQKPDITFSGKVYIRPCGRGFSVEDGKYGGWHLEDIFEENETYLIELTARKVEDEETCPYCGNSFDDSRAKHSTCGLS